MSRPEAISPRPARVTAAEVAELAGTSTATVSLVVNGKTAGRVSQTNIERVLSAVRELGYVVDHTASSLAKGTSNIVILVAPDLSNPFYGRVISGIKAELGNEYQLLLSVTGEGRNPSAADVHRLVALRPAGLLVEAPDDEFLRDLPAGAPLVLLDAPGRETQAPTVNFDLTGGIGALLAHLADRGHTRIGYLDSLTRTETFELRRSLVERGAAEHGMEYVAIPEAASLIDPDGAATVFAEHWPRWRDAGVTALVCATDSHAYGVLGAARELGISVPGTLAVSGFDNLPASAIVSPALTTVELPGEALGRGAVRALMAQRAEGDDQDHEPSPPTAAPAAAPLIGARLIVRDSA
ncbi:LacI family DNA-binding transcriptional regulator [Leucobacter aridicollis]|uniref:LacI family DNA-binding transcriptional regulator n=1 Tax=Leucobacter aridicollis TaxID=283878 RepID=UPI000E64C345|nr:LacI family DNA-binding transcriptional regulator [Leucobacter aridicollis]UTX53103.1 LacI family DNA-binding transcriptional regulator [Leucobacter aridicollis]